MKTIFPIILLSVVVSTSSCTKEYHYDPNAIDTTGNGNNGGGSSITSGYGSLNDFYSANEVKSQQFSVDAVAGSTFTTAAGTEVAIPANAFVTLSGTPVTGIVDISFKEIYRKSDMLLSDKPTMTISGEPLKSGGEFWIKASSAGDAVKLAPGSSIRVTQPLNGIPYDPDMLAFVIPAGAANWDVAQNAVVGDSANIFSNYVYTLYQFSPPEDSGTWCNSDNPGFFSAYPQTTFTVSPLFDVNDYYTDVFLLFTDLNCMVRVNRNSNSFPYEYAPEGLNCTVVTVAIKDSMLYSSFMPVTIGSNQTVDITVNPTSEKSFKDMLEALN